MIRLVCISDFHTYFPTDLPEGDILVMAGDATFEGRTYELEKFNSDLGNVPHKYKVFVAGNHDLMFEESPEIAAKLTHNITHYLNDSGCEIEGIKFWGSPVTPYFHNWAFNKFPSEIKKHWAKIPEDLDVLVTHGPPYGTLDLLVPGSKYRNHLGCPLLAEHVQAVKPRLHVFGHIHENGGSCKLRGPTLYVNASLLNDRYKRAFDPVVLDFDPKTRRFKRVKP